METRNPGSDLCSRTNRNTVSSHILLKPLKNTFTVSPPGDVLIKNETIESKLIIFRRQTLHRLEYKILNDDNLLSFAQIDIIDTDVGRRRMEIFSRY